MIRNPADLVTATWMLTRRAPKLLEQLGLPREDHELVKRVIGVGEYAVVYEIDDKRVLKITKDEDDAAAAEAVRHHGPSRGLVQIFEVGQVPLDDEDDTEFYVIVAERVLTKVSNEIMLATYYARLLMEGMFTDVNEGYIREIAQKKEWQVPSMYLIRSFFEDLIAARDTAWKLGFTVDHDLHLGNIGYREREGTYEAVVIDYGYQSWIKGDKYKLSMVANPKLVNNGPTIREVMYELDRAPELLKKLGVATARDLKVLGEGGYAIALEVPGNKVLKVTWDADDAAIADKVKEAGPLRGLVHIYEVYESKVRSFFVVAEKLKVLPAQPVTAGKDWIRQFDPILITLKLAMEGEWGWEDAEWKEYAVSEFPEADVRLAQLLKEDLKAGLENIRALGGHLRDVHAWNVGLRKGKDRWELAILDFGHMSWMKDRPQFEIAKNSKKSDRIIERLCDYKDPSYSAGSEGLDYILSRDPYQIAEYFDMDVSQADADAAADKIVEMSQQELKRLGLTGPITVYRGGRVPERAHVVPVSLRMSTAKGHATKWGNIPEERAKFWTAVIQPKDVAAVVDLFTGGAYDEKELLVWRKAFDQLAKNPNPLRAAFDHWFNRLEKAFPDFGKLDLHSEPKAHDGGRHYGYCKHSGDEISIAFAPEAEDLPENNIRGLMAHEFGHAIDFRYGKAALEKRLGELPRDVEERADAIANKVFGIKIKYDRSLVQCISCKGVPRPKGLR